MCTTKTPQCRLNQQHQNSYPICTDSSYQSTDPTSTTSHRRWPTRFPSSTLLKIMLIEYYPYSRRCLLGLIVRVGLSHSHLLSADVLIVMRLPSASWCVGASSLSMRREKIVRPYRILVSITEDFVAGMLRSTF